MKASFSASLKRVLVHEGGFSNHPRDPGGVTLEGVIQRVYDGYRVRKGLPKKPLTSLMRGTAEWNKERNEIYKLQYWDVCRCDELPAGVDYAVFDGAVNSGPAQAAKWLQRALKVAQIDGAVGEATLAKARAADPVALVGNICDQRMAFLQSLKTWSTFGPGWTRRVNEVRKAGVAMANGDKKPAPPTELPAEATGKAPASDTKTTETPAGNTATKTTTLGAGGLVAWVVTQFTNLSDHISTFVGMAPETGRYVVGAVVAVLLLAIVAQGAVTLYDVVRRKRRGEAVEAA